MTARSQTILLVEDNPGDRRLLRELLTYDITPAFEVLDAESLGDALTSLEKADVTLALVDLSMPDSEGLESVIRICERHTHLPVIVLTGRKDDRLALDAIKAGAQDYLLKNNLEPDTLRRAISYAVERKQTEVALSQARDTAEKALQDKARYLAFLSHETRTPLNAILGFAKLVSTSTNAEETNRYANQIGQTAEVLLSIINDMLDFSKIEAEQLKLRTVEMDLASLLADCLELLSGQANDKALALTSYLDPKLPRHIICDPTRLRQILINLISNAIKFTRHGYVHVECLYEGEDRLSISVIDTGIGIPEEDIEMIFQPYQQSQTELSTLSSGTGLGLSICSSLAKMMRGSLTASSQLGNGSTFKLDIPLQTPAVTHTHENALQGRSIVLLSQREPVREALTRTCRSLGATLISVDNITEISDFLKHQERSNPVTFMIDAQALSEPVDAVISRYETAFADVHSKLVVLDPTTPAPSRADCILTTPIRLSSLVDVLSTQASEQLATDVVPCPAAPIVATKRHILAVDDNPANRLLCKAMLEHQGHYVDTASDGNGALTRLAEKQDYSALLIDMHMPGMDGHSLAMIVNEWLPHLPLIALTGDEDVKETRREPFDDVFLKPVDWASLFERLDGLPVISPPPLGPRPR